MTSPVSLQLRLQQDAQLAAAQAETPDPSDVERSYAAVTMALAKLNKELVNAQIAGFEMEVTSVSTQAEHPRPERGPVMTKTLRIYMRHTRVLQDDRNLPF